MPTDSPRHWRPITLGGSFPAPAGAYSPAVRAGNLLFVAGQIPKDPMTGEIVQGDIRTQTRRVLDNLRLVLEAGGATLDDVVSVSVFLADANDWGAFNEVYRDILRPPYPARTAVGAQLRGILVEINAIAILPKDRAST
ncbi:MAG: RidA family protein [Gemmatimonadaceae bacterium]